MKPLVIKNVRQSDTLTAWLFLSPTLIIFITLVIFPVAVSFFLAFSQWNFMRGLGNIRFIGLNNFVRLMDDRNFKLSISNTFIYTLTTVPLGIIISMIIAYVLNGKIFGMKALRLCFFIPYIANTVAMAAVFKVLFRSNGLINQLLLNVFSIDNTKDWFSSPELNKIPVILFSTWSIIGYELVIFLAALQQIPSSLYEAADIDGASGISKFFRITIPMISPATFYLLIVRLIATFKIFTSVNVMSLGSYSRFNTSMVMEIYRRGFGSYDFGYASAMAWVLFVIILAVTIIQFLGQKKWVHY